MTMYKVSSSLHFVKASHGATQSSSSSEAHWAPNTDVYLTDQGAVIKVELAGMRREDLEVTIDGNRIRISGSRPDGCRAAKCNFMKMEINYGAFESIVDLPPGYDLSQARAAYQNGFLRIDVPVRAKTSKKSTTVPVRAEEH